MSRASHPNGRGSERRARDSRLSEPHRLGARRGSHRHRREPLRGHEVARHLRDARRHHPLPRSPRHRDVHHGPRGAQDQAVADGALRRDHLQRLLVLARGRVHASRGGQEPGARDGRGHRGRLQGQRVRASARVRQQLAVQRDARQHGRQGRLRAVGRRRLHQDQRRPTQGDLQQTATLIWVPPKT